MRSTHSAMVLRCTTSMCVCVYVGMYVLSRKRVLRRERIERWFGDAMCLYVYVCMWACACAFKEVCAVR